MIAQADSPLYLSPVVNGVAKDGVVTILPAKNGLLIRPATLGSIGILPHTGTAEPDGSMFIPKQGPVSAIIDAENQGRQIFRP